MIKRRHIFSHPRAHKCLSFAVQSLFHAADNILRKKLFWTDLKNLGECSESLFWTTRALARVKAKLVVFPNYM